MPVATLGSSASDTAGRVAEGQLSVASIQLETSLLVALPGIGCRRSYAGTVVDVLEGISFLDKETSFDHASALPGRDQIAGGVLRRMCATPPRHPQKLANGSCFTRDTPTSRASTV